MKRVFAAICGACLWAGAATAEQMMFDYFTSLTPTDAYNSRGVPLDDFCAIVQQDRANWHRFNRRDAHDQADPFFDSADRRAMIAGHCDYGRDYYANAGNRIRGGTRHFYVYVQVFGSNRQVTRVVISEGAG